jgi:hypothetical protein
MDTSLKGQVTGLTEEEPRLLTNNDICLERREKETDRIKRNGPKVVSA